MSDKYVRLADVEAAIRKPRENCMCGEKNRVNVRALPTVDLADIVAIREALAELSRWIVDLANSVPERDAAWREYVEAELEFARNTHTAWEAESPEALSAAKRVTAARAKLAALGVDVD